MVATCSDCMLSGLLALPLADSSGSEPIRSFGFASGLGDKYEIAEQLGSGTFGIVHVAVHRESGER